MHVQSRFYALTHNTRRRRLLGLALSTWLILLLLLLALWAFFARWSPWLVNGALALAALLAAGYWIIGRLGFTRFVPDPGLVLDPEFAAPRDESRVPLRATGIFSVRDFEGYVVEQPAEYWRVPMGHHIIMVQNGPGQYLYQILEPEHIRAVTPGYLLYGRGPQAAIAVQFAVSWSPEVAQEPRYYVGVEEPPQRAPTQERAIYFTFHHDADRHAVWRSLAQSITGAA